MYNGSINWFLGHGFYFGISGSLDWAKAGLAEADSMFPEGFLTKVPYETGPISPTAAAAT